MRGFSINTTAPVALNTTFHAVAIDGSSSVDSKAKPIPQSGKISNAAFSLTDVTSAVHFHAYLAWDAAGLYPINQPEQVDLYATATGGRHIGALTTQDVDITAPSVQTAIGTVYLLIKLNSGTANLQWATVQWTDNPAG